MSFHSHPQFVVVMSLLMNELSDGKFAVNYFDDQLIIKNANHYLLQFKTLTCEDLLFL